MTSKTNEFSPQETAALIDAAVSNEKAMQAAALEDSKEWQVNPFPALTREWAVSDVHMSVGSSCRTRTTSRSSRKQSEKASASSAEWGWCRPHPKTRLTCSGILNGACVVWVHFVLFKVWSGANRKREYDSFFDRYRIIADLDANTQVNLQMVHAIRFLFMPSQLELNSLLFLVSDGLFSICVGPRFFVFGSSNHRFGWHLRSVG
jgi:hypothetical protein